MIKITDLQAIKQNEHYKKYYKQKQKIKSKYPDTLIKSEGKGGKRFFEKGEQELSRKYLKEIADLILKPNGDFQKFSWDLINSVDKLQMERTARGSYTPQTYY
jgi:hypothetical protein